MAREYHAALGMSGWYIPKYMVRDNPDMPMDFFTHLRHPDAASMCAARPAAALLDPEVPPTASVVDQTVVSGDVAFAI